VILLPDALPKVDPDGFENVLDRELRRGEVVVHPVGSEWALLRVQECFLLESALSASLDVDRGVSMLRFRFCSLIIVVERLVSGAFHCFLQLNGWLGLVQDITPTGDVVLHQMVVQWVGDP